MTNLKLVITSSKGEPEMQNFKSVELVNGKVKETSNRREILLEDLINKSLLDNDDREISSNEVLTRYKLFRKLQGNNEIEFNQEEKDLIIKLVCAKYEILFAGQVVEALS